MKSGRAFPFEGNGNEIIKLVILIPLGVGLRTRAVILHLLFSRNRFPDDDLPVHTTPRSRRRTPTRLGRPARIGIYLRSPGIRVQVGEPDKV